MGKQSILVRYAPLIIGVLLVFLLLGTGLYFVLGIKSAPEQKKVVQQITVIKPPPPPPEPPPPEEIEEEIEEKLEEEVPEDPEPLPDPGADEPAGEELGLDADASAGGDSFGLKARKGGRGLLAGGGFAAYLKAEVNNSLIQDETLKYLDYIAVITLYLAENGAFERIVIDMKKGSDKTRMALERFFDEMGGVARSVPIEEQGKPLKMRISSVI